jgi:hypothetical protein
LNCGAGVYVKLLPPRYKAVPPDRWELMQEYFEDQRAEHAARVERYERQGEVQEAGADPVFREYVENLLERLNESWRSSKNPLVRESADAEPGDLERVIIKQIVQATTSAYVIEAANRDAELDRAQMDRETRLLMLLAAGGYLWRHLEREQTFVGPLHAAESSVRFMEEHPSPEVS